MKIANEFLTASFQNKGAELISLIKNGTEYIWQADPEHWARHAPVLFPVVGKLKDDTYTVNGSTYHLSQHGFARDEAFSVVSLEKDQIHFSLMGSLPILEKFPFRFNLLVSYKLIESAIEVIYEVRNTDTSKMYFSIGGHPAFNCPLGQQESRSDYWLEFEKEENGETHLLENSLFSGETETIFTGKKLPLREGLFEKDALVFKALNSTCVSLNGPDKKWLTFHFEGFPYLGIWSKNNRSTFVCIEPWFGLADKDSHDQELMKKEGIQSLEAGSAFTCSFQVELH